MYAHRWFWEFGIFWCEKCGVCDRESTSPPQYGCPVRA